MLSFTEFIKYKIDILFWKYCFYQIEKYEGSGPTFERETIERYKKIRYTDNTPHKYLMCVS